jgi:hypothetical protein
MGLLALLAFAVLGELFFLSNAVWGLVRLSAGWTVGWILLTIVAVALIPVVLSVVKRWRVESAQFGRGLRGEQATVRWLSRHLDENWVLFRNVELPQGWGDIDAVLIGPRGIYALEIKAYRGYHRNRGRAWHRRIGWMWRTVDSNPTRQALRNAAQLAQYLESDGVKVWVEPRVVWASDQKLWLERPAVSVWQLGRPEYILEDITSGKQLACEVLADAVAALHRLAR